MLPASTETGELPLSVITGAVVSLVVVGSVGVVLLLPPQALRPSIRMLASKTGFNVLGKDILNLPRFVVCLLS